MNLSPLDPPRFDGEEVLEILRVWLDRDPQSGATPKFVLLPKISSDPAAWGLILVDIARQVATAYAADEPHNEKIYSSILNRIKQGFDAEWEYPTE
ncbi:MAG: DUF5076 domain-containing protein [Planctomycetaceae bacterium]|jgi:hypothetical protein|nr:DUF5076 domain-containing protein [Planctomycetaceae bacterium]